MIRVFTSRTALAFAVVSVFALAALCGYSVDSETITAGLAFLPFMVGDTVELKTLIEAQGKAWEEFKSRNDKRLAEVEKNGAATAETKAAVDKITEELARLDKELKTEMAARDELEKRAQRPGAGNLTKEQAEYKAAFEDYLRKGKVDELLEKKALRGTSNVDGGYFLEEEMDATIDRVAATVSSFRTLANVRNVGAREYEKRVKTSGMSGRWVGETETGGETTNPRFSEIMIPTNKMEVEPWITNDLMEDSDYDLVQDLNDEAGIAFGETEAASFITGDGVKKPMGILAYPVVANASYSWGRLGYIVSGASGAFAASNPADKLIDTQHALKQQYRSGAVWLMSDATLAQVRMLKDGTGNYYLWNPDPAAGFSGRVLGSLVAVDDNMPAIAANSFSIAYGNFRRGYTITDRRGTILIRDNITTKGYTKFNMTRRVGGGVINFETIKFLKFGTS